MEGGNSPLMHFYNEKEHLGELSNFFKLESPIVYQGRSYPTSEHLYQALKFLTHPHKTQQHQEYSEFIRTASTPNKAKILANQWTQVRYPWQKELKSVIDRFVAAGIEPRDDWEDVRDEMMLLSLKEKFKVSRRCREVLLSTGDSQLAEHTTRDEYWADAGDGTGENMLGKLLMEVRAELREQQPINDNTVLLSSHSRKRNSNAITREKSSEKKRVAVDKEKDVGS